MNKNGNPQNLNKGGTLGNKGGGRHPDWLKAKCAKILKDKKLIEFLGNVASGKDVEQKINENGEVLKVPADVKDRLRAVEMLLDRGFGKPIPDIEGLGGGDKGRLVFVL